MADTSPTFSDVEYAAARIAPYAKRTPVLTCSDLDELVQAKLFFKCENFQKAGTFKFRGACNAVFSLEENIADKGVATHSSGNHAAALALAGALRNIPVHVVIPNNTVEIKKQIVMGYGAEITFCSPTLAARESTLSNVIAGTGAALIHPYNDERIIAGQGTVTLELMEEYTNLDAIIAPVGGGGLMSGTCIAARGINKNIILIGAEPTGADDARTSMKKGEITPQINPKTIADGLLTSLGDKTFPIIHETVKEILTVSEAGIIQAMRLIWEQMHIIIEPSSAVVLGALLEHPGTVSAEQIGLILSGGNANLDHLPWQN